MDTRPHALGITSCCDMFDKADRELVRFVGSIDPVERTDHAINFCVTAWHLADWVWRDYLNGNGKLQKKLGFQGSKGEFFRSLRARHNGFVICDMIANGFKHGGDADPQEGRKNIRSGLDEPGATYGELAAESVLGWPKIFGDICEPALAQSLREVIETWRADLWKLGIPEREGRTRQE